MRRGRIRQIYNEAWEKNWGFVPFTEKEFGYMTKEMKPLLIPELVWLAEIDGKAVGFILCVPDINVALKKSGTAGFLPMGCRSGSRSCFIIRADSKHAAWSRSVLCRDVVGRASPKCWSCGSLKKGCLSADSSVSAA